MLLFLSAGGRGVSLCLIDSSWYAAGDPPYGARDKVNKLVLCAGHLLLVVLTSKELTSI